MRSDTDRQSVFQPLENFDKLEATMDFKESENQACLQRSCCIDYSQGVNVAESWDSIIIMDF